MNIPCANFSPCPDVYPPYVNLSSEDPDRFVCIGRSWGNYQSPPRIGSQWTEKDCYQTCDLSLSNIDLITCRALGVDMCSGECVQSVSQSLSNICAANGSASDCNPDPTHPCVYNTPQTCTVTCPDGTGFTYTTPAGIFCDTSQALANAKAYSYACNQANSLRNCSGGNIVTRYTICLSELSTTCTTEASISLTITAFGDGVGAINHWTLSSGSLPTGMTLDTTAPGASTTISGTPTTAGVYTFAVRVTGPSGAFATKSYVVEVLPEGTVGTAYHKILNPPSCAPTPSNRGMFGSMAAGVNWVEDMTTTQDIADGTPTTASICAFALEYTPGSVGPPAVTVASLVPGLVTFACTGLTVGKIYQISAKFTQIGLGGPADATWAPFIATGSSMQVMFAIEAGVTSIYNPVITQQ